MQKSGTLRGFALFCRFAGAEFYESVGFCESIAGTGSASQLRGPDAACRLPGRFFVGDLRRSHLFGRLLRPPTSSPVGFVRPPAFPLAPSSARRPFRSPLRPPAGFSVCRPFRSPLRPPGSEHLGHDVGASADEDHVFGRSLFASPLQGLAHLPEGFTL